MARLTAAYWIANSELADLLEHGRLDLPLARIRKIVESEDGNTITLYEAVAAPGSEAADAVWMCSKRVSTTTGLTTDEVTTWALTVSEGKSLPLANQVATDLTALTYA